MLTRRRLLACGVAPAFIPRLRAASRAPNLLFLLADDHAAYALGADGNRQAKTPNLDALASAGVRFTHAYCNSPVCTPSRQSVLTGLMPHAAGVTRLPTPLPRDKAVFSDQLRKAGIRTAAFGKMHLHDREPRDGAYGFDVLMTEGRIAQQWRRDVQPAPIPEIATRKFPWQPMKDPAREWLNAACLPYPRRDEDMLGTYVAREAMRYMEENADRRFAVWVSLMEPHSPFDFPLEDRGKFDPRQFVVPRAGPEDASQIPNVFRELTDAQKQGIAAAYYTSLHFMDRNVGRVLDKLKQLRLEENTLVIYIGDNGYCLGQHGRFEKHCGYEEAMRVPLLVRWSGKVRPRVAAELVEFVDLAPTILDLLDAPALEVQHGRSLSASIYAKEQPAQRRAVVSEYLENEEVYVRTDRWKLMHGSGRRARQDGYITDNPTPGRTVRLYDLRSDPHEFHDVARDHPDVVAGLQGVALERFRDTHPEAEREPTTGSRADKLEFYLRPRDV
jgi:arylsulfatase A-like enzyme